MNLKMYTTKLFTKSSQGDVTEEQGFTIIELLIAIVISAIVIGAAGFGLVALLRANRTAEAQSVRRIELNRALDYIADDIRQARQVYNYYNPVNAYTGLRIVLADSSTIDYYYQDVSSITNSIWLKPGVVRRIYNNGTSQVLVDGVVNPIAIGDTSIAANQRFNGCLANYTAFGYRSSTPTTFGGFLGCTSDTFRTASLYLYGTIENDYNSKKDQDVLLVSSKFVTRNVSPPGLCLVPDFSGINLGDPAKPQNSKWYTDFRFTGPIYSYGTGAVYSQSLPVGTQVSCSSSIAVADATGSCTVPSTSAVNNVIGQTMTNAYNTLRTAGFTSIAYQRYSTTAAVYAVTPNPGTITACQTPVTLTERSCTVPTYVGTSVNRTTLSTWNGYGGTVDHSDSNTVYSDYRVNQQSIAGGQSTFCSTPLSLSEKKCTIPDFSTGTVYNTTNVLGYYGGLWQSDSSAIVASGSGQVSAAGSPGTDISSQSLLAGGTAYCSLTLSVYGAQNCVVGNYIENFVGKTRSYVSTRYPSGTWNSYGGSITYVGNPSATDFVIGTQDLSNMSATVACGTPLTLTEKQCTVPNYVSQTAPTSSAFSTGKWNTESVAGSIIFNPPSGTFTVGRVTLSDGTVLYSTAGVGTNQQYCSVPITVASNASCTVPNVLGMTLTQAQTAWTTAGFTLGNLTSSNLSSGGRVFTQSVATGTSANCSTGTMSVDDIAPTLTTFNTPSTTNMSGISDVSRVDASLTNYVMKFGWNALAGATSYEIYRCGPTASNTTSCTPTLGTAWATSSTNSYTIPSPGFAWNQLNNAQYCFSVRAVNPSSNTALSNVQCVSNNTCKVPNIVGDSTSGGTSTVDTKLSSAGLNGTINRTSISTGQKEVSVQSPAANSLASCNATISYTYRQ